MPSAAPGAWNHLRATQSSRGWLVPCALLLSACSVYSEELVGGEASGIDDDDSPSAGKGDGASGKTTSGSGGKSAGLVGGTGNVSMTGGTSSMNLGGTTAAGAAGEAPGGAAGSSGSGGTQVGSGGVGGNGSAGTGGGGAPVTLPDLLDGFEDQDLTLEQTSGRGGVWYLFDDGTVGKAGPSPLVCSELAAAPAALGAFGMHITASGFTGWGSGLGVDFRAGKVAYDGSKHSGIRFWARVGAGKNTRHRVQLVDGTSDALGGKCDPALDAINGAKCEDHFGTNLIFSSVWTQYSIGFADLTQIGWGHSAPSIDKTTLYGLQVTAKAKLDVELWLDQIEFF